MKILIAGAGGFVGSALVRRLAAHELVLPSRNPEKFIARDRVSSPLFNSDLERLVADQKPDIVINLLGLIREAAGETFGLVHEEYTRRLLAGARAAGVKKFIQMSALGAAPDAPSAYHRSKFAGEELVRTSGLPYVIFRPSLITGPGQKLLGELRSIARFTPLLAAPSDCLAAPLPVEEVAACFARAAEDPAIGGEVFELAGDRVMNFREIFEEALSSLGLRRPVIGLPLKLFFPLLPLFRLFPVPPMTLEQYRMLNRPNLPSGAFRGVKDL
jgi:NADH dehydrogenase